MAAEAQRDTIASVFSTQSSPIASAKSPPRKSKASHPQNGPFSSNPSPTALDVASPSPFPALRPFRRYSRRALVALSKSPLVAPPPGMPALKDWFGEWEPHVSPRKENDHHASSNSNPSARNRPSRREAADDDSRSSYKNQFAQISQTMGNFRHHSSRLDERADRDSHERLRNLSESYDRNKLLATNASGKRDPLSKTGPSFASRRGDDRDKDARDKDAKERSDSYPWDRRDNSRSERSSDWRRTNAVHQESEDVPLTDRRAGSKSERTLDSHREDDSRKERSSRPRGRSPSPNAHHSGVDRARAWERRRSQSRPREEHHDRERRTQGRRGKEEDISDDRERRAANGSSRRSGRDGDREREKDGSGKLDGRGQKDATREKEPAWMGDYVPETSDEIFARSHSKDADIDDLQAWKRQLREQAAAASGDMNIAGQQVFDHSQTSSDGLDDIQRFKLKLKEQETWGQDANTAPAPIGDGLRKPMPSDIPNGLLPPLDLVRPTRDPSSSESAPNNAKPADSQPLTPSNHRVIFETQSPLSVAGIDAEHSFQRFTSVSQSPINPDVSKAFSNGKLTPTPSASLGSNTSGTSPSQYAERTDSPGSSTSPAPQSGGKGSRFAKFWDNRSKDTAAPPPASSPASSLNAGSFNGWGTGPSETRPSRAQPQPVSNVGSSKTLDGLLQHLSMNDSHSTTNRTLPHNNPDSDRMQNLLSMLSSSQGPPSRADRFNNHLSPPTQEYPQHAPLANYPPYSSQSNPLPPNSSELDRTFVPDGMVPGLRLPQRPREASVPQLPSLTPVGPSATATYMDEHHDLYHRLHREASWEQLQTRSGLSTYPSGAQNQPLGLHRMSTIPPPSQPNALRQSPNHLQQQSSMRNPRVNYDLSAFCGPQFASMNPDTNIPSSQYGGSGGSISGASNAGVLLPHRVPDTMLNQGFSGNVPQSNSFGSYDVSPQHVRESQNPLLMSGGSMNGPALRDLDGVRGNMQSLPIYQSHSSQHQHLLPQQGHSQRSNPSAPYAMQTPLGQQISQPSLTPMQSSVRAGGLGGPSDYITGPSQSYSARPYVHPPQQGQPDFMALLMGGHHSFRAE